MAILQVNFLSRALFRTVPAYVILPTDRIPAAEDKPFPTLYLLHGLLGNYTDWVHNTRIQQLAEDKRLAVVMPSGDNSFYVDNPVSKNGVFIGQELVQLTRRMFPLSHRRADTFIAGLSMGGFGALRNGLCYPETFGYIAGLSSAVHLFETPLDDPARNVGYEDAAFGDMREAMKTDKNPRVALQNLLAAREADASVPLPKIYLACGTEDTLLGPNRVYRDLFRAAGIDLTYEEGPGKHDWDFWNTYIGHVLDWLPLGEAKAGLSSGHVTADE